MPESVERPSREAFAARWVGTIADIGDVAQTVFAAFERTGTRPHDFYIEVETFDGSSRRALEYGSVEAFLEGARTLDLQTVYGVTISGSRPHGPAAVDDQTAYVTFKPDPRLAVCVVVQAPASHEQFISEAFEAVNKAVERGERRMPEVEKGVQVVSVLGALGATFILALARGNAWTITALVLAVIGVVVLLTRRVVFWLFPPFELISEDGASRFARVWNRTSRAVADAARPVYVALLGAIMALLLRRLIS